jgi:hypothetical protein
MDENIVPLSKKDYKKLFKNKNGNTEVLYIYLYLHDLLMDPDEILLKVGVPYFKKIKTGDIVKRGNGSYQAQTNSLSFRKEYPGVLVPEVELSHFFEEIILPNSEYFVNIFRNSNARICMVYYYYHSNNIGIVLPSEAIKYLSKFNLEIDFDLYCLYEDDIETELQHEKSEI